MSQNTMLWHTINHKYVTFCQLKIFIIYTGTIVLDYKFDAHIHNVYKPSHVFSRPAFYFVTNISILFGKHIISEK